VQLSVALNDEDFRQLKYVETKTATDDLPSSKIDPGKLVHLVTKTVSRAVGCFRQIPSVFSRNSGIL